MIKKKVNPSSNHKIIADNLFGNDLNGYQVKFHWIVCSFGVCMPLSLCLIDLSNCFSKMHNLEPMS